MAEIVAAVATSHILMSPDSAGERAWRVFTGMRAVGQAVQSAKPDVIVVLSNDHLFNFDLEVDVPFLVGAAEQYTPFGDMDIPQHPVAGHRDFALGFATHAQAAGFAVIALDHHRPDHGTMIPLLFANPENTIPVVPVYINLANNAAPSADDCWRLGEALRQFIQDQRPADERVAIIATGGLSHWVGYDGKGVNEEFDCRFLNDMASGKAELWRVKPSEDIEWQAGNGGLEIVNWLILAASVPGARGEIVYYEPVPEWMTGMGGMIMKLS
ncbi:MAG: protocatechuate 3,4-dioxygenase [Sphingomonadales bacterium]|nr:protocatechuate 3,4-dioxygenase [Sphingomonadales bacterium]